MRGLDVVGLVRPEIDQRREEQQVRSLRQHRELVEPLARHDRFGKLEPAPHPVGMAPEPGPPVEAGSPSGRGILARALRELRRMSVPGSEKPHVVAGLPQRPDDVLPGVDAGDRQRNHVDARVVREPARQFQWFLALPRGGEHHRVPTAGELLDDSFEVAGLPEVVDEEQDFHAVGGACGPRRHSTMSAPRAEAVRLGSRRYNRSAMNHESRITNHE